MKYSRVELMMMAVWNNTTGNMSGVDFPSKEEMKRELDFYIEYHRKDNHVRYSDFKVTGSGNQVVLETTDPSIKYTYSYAENAEGGVTVVSISE